MSALPVFAFGVTSLPMLGWLAAAVLPLAIHFLSRRRYRQTYWAAMEYLLAAIRANRRRLQLEQFLLLAVRTLIVVLVVLAFAEPYFERKGFVFVAGQNTHRVLVIDGSYSMGYKPGEASRFQRAKELASRIVEESPPGDGFTLILMSSPPKVVVGHPAPKSGDFLREIEDLSLAHTTSDLPSTLAKVEQVLVASRREQPKLTGEEVYFLTDLGRVGWMPDSNELARFRQRAKRLSESAGLVVIDLGQEDADNLAVTSVQTGEPFATVGHSLHVEAELKNLGRQTRSQLPVQLLVDGRRAEEERVDIPPGTSVSVGFSCRFESAGDHSLEIRLDGDRLDVDDHRYLVVPVKPYINVLCVEGRPSGQPFGGATDYLSAALSPQGRAGRSPVRPDVMPESKLLELDLDRYDCIFLADVAQFTSSEAQALDAYLEKGGSLIFFLGDQVLADRYNRELAGEKPGGVRLLPARLGALIDKPQYRLDPLGYRHPIVREFRNHEQAGLLTTPVAKHFELIVPRLSKAKVALALEDGDPLIVEEPIKRGRVVLFATSADDSWTLMPKWPSYLPLVRDSLNYAIGEQIRQRNVSVGQALGGPISADDAEVPPVVQAPDGKRDEVRVRTEEGSYWWSHVDTGTSGIYSIEFARPDSLGNAFAVNVDPVESDLARITQEELHNQVWPDVPFVHQTTWQDLDRRPSGPINRRNSLPKALLYAVLGLLFIETYMAWRFGYHNG